MFEARGKMFAISRIEVTVDDMDNMDMVEWMMDVQPY